MWELWLGGYPDKIASPSFSHFHVLLERASLAHSPQDILAQHTLRMQRQEWVIPLLDNEINHKHQLAFDSMWVFIGLGLLLLGMVQKKHLKLPKPMARCVGLVSLFKANSEKEAPETAQRW